MKNTTIKVGITAMALGLAQFAIADNIYSIYPIPQQQIAVQGTAKVTSNVNIIIEKGIDKVTQERIADVLKQHNLKFSFTEQPVKDITNIYLGINGSEQIADQKATSLKLDRNVFSLQHKFDRHCLSLTADNGIANILILGENTDATFYGIASLEQMLDNDINDLPCVTINDYADQKSRGIVEGYYGYPYSVEVKKDLMRFMMRYKMNTYMYGAKSDPYHSQYWKQPYPTSLTAQQVKNGWLSKDMLKDITEVSHKTKVNFIWAIHPGNDITNSSTVVRDVTSKFDKMYDLGVRQFAVFVDDVSIPESDHDLATNAKSITDIQKALEKKYNIAGAEPADTVKPLHFVPQVYCSSFAGNETKRKKFFKALSVIPKNITVYTTGWGVWSVPNYGDFQRIKDELGRPGAWWWNYPCNDNADGQIYPMDMYSNFYDMPAVNNNSRLPNELDNGLGIVCNPMQQGEISKIPVFSAADFAWNASGFNNIKSWKASFLAIVGKERASALQLLAKYLRWNDPDELNDMFASFKNSLNSKHPKITELQEKMTEINQACTIVETLKDSEKESDRLLYKDLAPWLLKLKQMTSTIDKLLTVSATDNEDTEKWNNYIVETKNVAALDTAELFKAYALEGMGNGISVSVRPSQPSQRYMYPFIQYLKENALHGYFPEEKANRPLKISNIKDYCGYAVNSRGLVYLNTGDKELNKNDYIGIDIFKATQLEDIEMDKNLLSDFTLVYSGNGKNWKKFTDKESLLKDYVRYICLQNTGDATKTIHLNRRNFTVTLPIPTKVSSVTLPNGPIWDNHNSDYLTDGDYNTFVCLKRNQINGDKYVLKLTRPMQIHDVRICMGTVNGDHMNIGNVEISDNGKTWKKIKVKGTNTYDFTMNLPQVVKYSDEMSYCDFEGNGEEAQYVRLNLKNARTNKWLRFYEMEVNKKGDKLKYKSECVDNEGIGIDELSDKLGYTHMNNVKQSVTCNFTDIHFIKSVQIYQDASVTAENPATIRVSSNGTDWIDYGKLTENRQVVDLSEQSDATFMKIEWTGKAPAIYEIVMVNDETQQSEVTKVEQLSTAATINFTFNGKAMNIQSENGIKSVDVYSLDGKAIMNYEASGARFLQLPLFTNGAKTYIIKVGLNNGENGKYKIICQ